MGWTYQPPQERSNMKEIWKDIKGYEGLYQVSNLGRIKSLPKYNCKYEKILKLHTNKRDGRQSIMLCKDSLTRKRMLVHRLVAITFIKNPLNLHEINHKDENPQNNSVDNLEWCTRKYNMNYGTTPSRLNIKNRKPVYGENESTLVKYEAIRWAKKDGYDGAGILYSIKNNRLYKGLKWRYANGNQ